MAELSLFSSWSPLQGHGLLPLRLARMFRNPGGALARRVAPSLDISEDERRYVVTVELAGCRKEDVELELVDRVLSIRGEKREERAVRGERSHRVERSYGSFQRSFALPADAVVERLEASFGDGVLTIEVPKAKGSRPRTISIR